MLRILLFNQWFINTLVIYIILQKVCRLQIPNIMSSAASCFLNFYKAAATVESINAGQIE